MYNNNKSEKYYFYEYKLDKEENTYHWMMTRMFPNKDSLISFLADSVKTNNSLDTYRWSSPYFNELNVSASDIYTVHTWDFTGDIPSPKTITYLRPYHFRTDSYACVDVRNFKEEVFKRVFAKMSNLLPKKKYTYRWRYRHDGKRWHHCTHYRTNSHLYTTLRNTQEEEYEDANGNVIKFKPKSKDMEAKFKWRDDFWTRGECGWKTHKNKHQWEHRLKN